MILVTRRKKCHMDRTKAGGDAALTPPALSGLKNSFLKHVKGKYPLRNADVAVVHFWSQSCVPSTISRLVFIVLLVRRVRTARLRRDLT